MTPSDRSWGLLNWGVHLGLLTGGVLAKRSRLKNNWTGSLKLHGNRTSNISRTQLVLTETQQLVLMETHQLVLTETQQLVLTETQQLVLMETQQLVLTETHQMVLTETQQPHVSWR
ncbi:hypothetical protein FQA47_021292 [Oryzias melastigma]|uniref:Uncharacterized protein n=1 Tax=Oryzias melastigma TaxID=30732 RepID=A0A834C6A2_ORYME|nr:hypothetical protein FQA47_021292 [Oryzias melastigma]